MRKNRDVVKNAASAPVPTIGASVTDQTVSDPFHLLGDGRAMLIAIRVSGVTAATGVTAALWTGNIRAADGTVTFRSNFDKQTSITGNGVFEIRMNPEDGTDVTRMPLGVHAKITVTTGAGDAVTVNEIRVIEVDRPT